MEYQTDEADAKFRIEGQNHGIKITGLAHCLDSADMLGSELNVELEVTFLQGRFHPTREARLGARVTQPLDCSGVSSDTLIQPQWRTSVISHPLPR